MQKDVSPASWPPTSKKAKSGPLKATYDYYGDALLAVFVVRDDVDPLERVAQRWLALAYAEER
jgi:hypothetical protein